MIRWAFRPMLLTALFAVPAMLSAQAVSYVRYQLGSTLSDGRLEGDQIVKLRDAPWVNATPTGVRVPRARVRLLASRTARYDPEYGCTRDPP